MSHAQDRAKSRYGINLERTEFLELRRQITEGEAEKIKRLSKNRGVYVCILNSTRLIVVYSRTKKFFITILPWSYLEEVNYKKITTEEVRNDK